MNKRKAVGNLGIRSVQSKNRILKGMELLKGCKLLEDIKVKPGDSTDPNLWFKNRGIHTISETKHLCSRLKSQFDAEKTIEHQDFQGKVIDENKYTESSRAMVVRRPEIFLSNNIEEELAPWILSNINKRCENCNRTDSAKWFESWIVFKVGRAYLCQTCHANQNVHKICDYCDLVRSYDYRSELRIEICIKCYECYHKRCCNIFKGKPGHCAKCSGLKPN